MNNVLRRAGWLVLLAVAGFHPLVLVAQDDPVPPPKPPFVSMVPDSASWKMTFSKPKRAEGIKPPSDPSKQALGDLYVRSLDVTKSGTARREVTTWSNGTSTEAWVIGDLNVSEDLKKELVIRPTSSTGRSAKDALQYFPLLEWINLQNYKGIEVVGGKKCYAFKQTTQLAEVAAGYFAIVPGMSSQTVAHIDVETKLPVSAQVNEVTVTFTFGPGSDTPLAVPEKFRQAVAHYQSALKRLTHVPSPP